MRQRTFAILLMGAWLAATPAQAQDDNSATPPSTDRAVPGSAHRLAGCEPERGALVCLDARRAGEGAQRVRRRGVGINPAASAFTKLTRFAGMFMGRVDSLSLGSWRMRVKLDLR